jgi:hypothetical protein
MNTCACGVLLLLALVERCLAPEWAVFNQRSIGLTVGRAHTCTFFGSRSVGVGAFVIGALWYARRAGIIFFFFFFLGVR